MTDTLQTAEAAGTKVLDGAETAVASLLAQLRLPPDNNTAVTVIDWLDQHGVLDAVDTAAKKIAADTAAKAAADVAAAEAPPATVPAASVPAAAGEGSSLASAAAPPAAAPVEPTAAAAAAAAEAAANTSGNVPAEAVATVSKEETKSAIVGAMHTVIDLLEKL
jgi:hypothetical protein